MTYRLPSLNALRAFEAAARNLSFQAAAGELGVTSGAVSQQVRKLEHSLGVGLFCRLPHGLLLTREGETYLPKISRVFDDLTTATEEIAPDMNARKFSIGVCPQAAAILPKGWPVAERCLKPYVRERLDTSDTSRVRSGELDCLVRLGGDPVSDLELIIVASAPTASGANASVNLVCKPSLTNCRQTTELVSNIRDLLQVQA